MSYGNGPQGSCTQTVYMLALKVVPHIGTSGPKYTIWVHEPSVFLLSIDLGVRFLRALV